MVGNWFLVNFLPTEFFSYKFYSKFLLSQKDIKKTDNEELGNAIKLIFTYRFFLKNQGILEEKKITIENIRRHTLEWSIEGNLFKKY